MTLPLAANMLQQGFDFETGRHSVKSIYYGPITEKNGGKLQQGLPRITLIGGSSRAKHTAYRIAACNGGMLFERTSEIPPSHQ